MDSSTGISIGESHEVRRSGRGSKNAWLAEKEGGTYKTCQTIGGVLTVVDAKMNQKRGHFYQVGREAVRHYKEESTYAQCHRPEPDEMKWNDMA